MKRSKAIDMLTLFYLEESPKWSPCSSQRSVVRGVRLYSIPEMNCDSHEPESGSWHLPRSTDARVANAVSLDFGP